MNGYFAGFAQCYESYNVFDDGIRLLHIPFFKGRYFSLQCKLLHCIPCGVRGFYD